MKNFTVLIASILLACFMISCTSDQAKLDKLKKHSFEDGSAIYSNPYFFHETNSNNVSIDIYKSKTGSFLLFIRMSYSGTNAIFFKRAELSYEGKSKLIKFNYYDDHEIDRSGNIVFEYVDVRINSEEIDFLRDFAKSKDAKISLTGEGSKTRYLTDNEKKGIIDVLNGYDVLMDKEYSMVETLRYKSNDNGRYGNSKEYNSLFSGLDILVLLYILYYIVTIALSVYILISVHILARDANKICDGDGEKTTGLLKFILLTMVTLGIYQFVWVYKLGNRLFSQTRYNITIKGAGKRVLLWMLLPIGIGLLTILLLILTQKELIAMILNTIACVGPFMAFYILTKDTKALMVEYNKKQPLSYTEGVKERSQEFVRNEIPQNVRNTNQTTAGTQISATDELRKLKQLLDDGIISQEDFDIKKKQLLGL